jgi:hypothetical protein
LVVTGIAAMIVGLLVIVWSLFFVQKQRGPTVFLLIFILLLLVGGGVAQILFFPFIWLVSTRIDNPLTWWRRVLPAKIHIPLGKLWPWSLIIASTALVFALEIAITGFVPGVNDPETVLAIMVFCLLLVVLVLPLAFLSGFARDIAQEG